MSSTLAPKPKRRRKPPQPKKRGKASVHVGHSNTLSFSCHLSYLARFQNLTLHYEVARDSKSRCGANFVLRARDDITWAIMDSGIDANHPHFRAASRTSIPASPLHADFTDTPNVPKGRNAALIDRFGHGTHVAGIVAGEQLADGTAKSGAKNACGHPLC